MSVARFTLIRSFSDADYPETYILAAENSSDTKPGLNPVDLRKSVRKMFDECGLGDTYVFDDPKKFEARFRNAEQALIGKILIDATAKPKELSRIFIGGPLAPMSQDERNDAVKELYAYFDGKGLREQLVFDFLYHPLRIFAQSRTGHAIIEFYKEWHKMPEGDRTRIMKLLYPAEPPSVKDLLHN